MLTEEEMMVIERNKALEKQREEERIRRLNQYDELAFQQFERVNKIFLKINILGFKCKKYFA